jgi:hypothetical protein
MLYVLMALVCVGAMGSLVLSMAKKEKADSSLRYSSELARYGATGGLTLAVNEPLRTQKFVDLIEKWYKVYNGKLTIPNSEKEQWEKEKYLDLGVIDKIEPSGTSGYYQDQNGNKLRARVVNVDFSGLQQNPPVINMMVECESIDKSGSRAKNVAFYKVHGWEEEREENAPNSALYLGGGMDEINVPLTVTGVTGEKGHTFLRGSGVMNENGHIFGNSTLYEQTGDGGEFRIRGKWITPIPADSKNPAREQQAGILNGASFYGPAYFGYDNGLSTSSVRTWFNKKNTFYGKFGLETSVRLIGDGQEVDFHDDVYLNGYIVTHGNNSNKTWKFYDKRGSTPANKIKPILTYTQSAVFAANVSSSDENTMWKASKADNIDVMYSTDNDYKPNVPTSQPNSMSSAGMLRNLGMKETDPPSINIRLDKLPNFPTALTPVNGKTPGMVAVPITGADLNAEYEKQKAANTLYRYSGMPPEENGWMLLRLGSNTSATIFDSPSSGNTGANTAFTGKMVLLIDGNTGGNPGSNINLFVSGQNSNSLILVEHERNAAQLGHNNLIRGLIVKRGNGQLNFKSTGTNMILRGAAYCVKGDYPSSRPEFRLEGGASNRITIEYDPSVLRQIMKELPEVVCIIEENGKSSCDDNDSQSQLVRILETGIRAEQVSRLF